MLEGGQRRKGTILSATDSFKNFDAWREEAGKGAPETLTRADMREFKSWLLKRMASSTARKHWTRVHAMYRYLVDEELIAKDPTRGIEPPILTQKTPRVWTMDDLRMMIAKAGDSNIDRLVLLAFVLTGMREGEVRKLSWKPQADHETSTRAYVDLEDNVIRVTGAKGGKLRNVPIHPLLRAELEALRRDMDESGSLRTDWLFPDRNEVRRTMCRLLKAASSPGGEHQFRRTALTWFDRHGVRDIVAKSIVGHAAQGVTQVHYLSVDDAEKIAAIRGLYAGELPGTEPPPVATLQVVEGDGELASLRKVIEEQAATIKTLTTMLAGRGATA